MSETPSGNSAPGDVRVQIAAQYVKDLSFENPNAPDSLRQRVEQPDVTVRFDIQISAVGEQGHEVALSVTVDARNGEAQLFLIELTYAGIFIFSGLPDGQLRPRLMVDCPQLLFPYARSIISTAVRDGGFPPLMLQPVDFAELYRRSVTETARQTATSEATPDS